MAEGRPNIAFVPEEDLCTCCGMCEGICPEGAIGMTETPGGLLQPQIDEEKCTQCGACIEVCPGWKVERIWPEGSDAFKGQVLDSYLARAADPAVRLDAQSAGAVTALLECLMEQGDIDGALVTTMPNDGSLRPQPGIARTIPEIKQACGSKYCPTGSNRALAEIRQGERVALVGLGCHVHGLRRAEMNLPSGAESVQVAIGLVCEGMLSYGAMDYLVEKSGLTRDEVSSLRFKSKKLGGWPGDTLIESTDGKEWRVGGGHRLSGKPGFKLPRCMLCWDKLNVGADIVAGDPWGIRNDKEGWNVLLVRTEKGRAILDRAIEKGVLVVEPIEAERIYGGQQIDERRKRCAEYLRAWQAMDRSLPEVAFEYESADVKSQRVRKRELAEALAQVNSSTSEEAMSRARRRITRAKHKRWMRTDDWGARLRRQARRLKRKAGW